MCYLFSGFIEGILLSPPGVIDKRRRSMCKAFGMLEFKGWERFTFKCIQQFVLKNAIFFHSGHTSVQQNESLRKADDNHERR